MEGCREELVLTPPDLEQDPAVGLWESGRLHAVAQVSGEGQRWELKKLFVEPAGMGLGFGRPLFEWAAATVELRGGTVMVIAADREAAPFYQRIGVEDAGQLPSGSIAGVSCRSSVSVSGGKS